MPENFQADNLRTESDVEQKIIWPLLTSQAPHGLALPEDGIFTKVSIKSITIGKGKSKKNYYPDYVFVHAGIPLLVIEAKAVGEDLEEAMREARLYSSELNARYSAQVDPVQHVIACNGERLIAGRANTESPEFDILAKNFSQADVDFSAFLEAYGHNQMSKRGEAVLKKSDPNDIGSREKWWEESPRKARR
ncbi:type I restriction enzyme HsdR N-terminal domain-containing protein [Phaeobacter sp.]|uniref:type I restriction enzyme HsdR N-terminal domain-containing protein n=1 Tax=Phaeobacter sp. TaxID=1902409 RepID=UPI0025CF3655|nr:type I restriction enzyme HsdR N-terminal domain-containing protein [Phaeobacter sp.]